MKALDLITSFILAIPRIILFILFSMLTFSMYSSNDPSQAHLTSIVNYIGGISFLLWLLSISYKTNQKLLLQSIKFKTFLFFILGLFLILSSILLMFFLSNDNITLAGKSENLSYNITYTRPLIVSIVLVLVLIVGIITSILTTAKLLVCAESGKNVSFRIYFPTFWLLVFPWIGLWFIMPRIKRIFD
jgi:hypothetical protein